MKKEDLERHLKALTFRYDKLASEHARLKAHYEQVYQHYKKIFWRFYFK